MLRLARYRWPGGSSASGGTILLWRARRALGRRRKLFGLLLATLPMIAAVALWPHRSDDPISLPNAPLAVAAGPAGRLYMAMADGRVWAVDGAGLRLVGAVSGVPIYLAAGPAPGQVFVTTYDTVAALGDHGAGWRAALPPRQRPVALAVDDASDRVYVAVVAVASDHGRGGDVVALDASTGGVVAVVPVGEEPRGLAVDPSAHRLYVADAADGTIAVLAGDPPAAVAAVRVGGAPDRLAVDARAGRLYAIDRSAGSLTVIDVARAAVAATVPVGILPTDIAVDPATGRVFVADSGAGTIAVLGGDATPIATLRAGPAPYGLAADPAGGRLYAVDLSMNSVWRIEDRRIQGPVARLFALAGVRESPMAGEPMPWADPADG